MHSFVCQRGMLASIKRVTELVSDDAKLLHVRRGQNRDVKRHFTVASTEYKMKSLFTGYLDK